MPETLSRLRSPLTNFTTVMIRSYQRLISPRMGVNCRFQPTCSQYAIEAIDRHGFFKGGWMAVVRLSKCHPLHDGGYDPVPEKR